MWDFIADTAKLVLCVAAAGFGTVLGLKVKRGWK